MAQLPLPLISLAQPHRTHKNTKAAPVWALTADAKCKKATHFRVGGRDRVARLPLDCQAAIPVLFPAFPVCCCWRCYLPQSLLCHSLSILPPATYYRCFCYCCPCHAKCHNSSSASMTSVYAMQGWREREGFYCKRGSINKLKCILKKYFLYA